ncbi:VQ domain-containing protein [Dioscorea alata]|uniref:VQ domain-containing protein n=1 Tax=Dioscorea alata TaxID=55571 RepID=A0ACB7W4E4_DIOAL|nr:VQ domain-containing protein [Dioscorea alata]
MNMPSKRARIDPVKVKVIVTRFVKTDALDFKSVVQSLTGKDSMAAEETVPLPIRPTVVKGGKRQVVDQDHVADDYNEDQEQVWNIGEHLLIKPNFVLEEFEDKCFLEAPPLEKMYELWSCFA